MIFFSHLYSSLTTFLLFSFHVLSFFFYLPLSFSNTFLLQSSVLISKSIFCTLDRFHPLGGETEALRRMAEKVSARPAWVCQFQKPDTSPNSLEPSTTVSCAHSFDYFPSSPILLSVLLLWNVALIDSQFFLIFLSFCFSSKDQYYLPSFLISLFYSALTYCSD